MARFRAVPLVIKKEKVDLKNQWELYSSALLM